MTRGKGGEIQTRDRGKHLSFGKTVAKSRHEVQVIEVTVSEQELLAISEFAAQCGETTSDLVRKCIIRHATLADGYGQLDPAYEFRMKMPDDCPASVQRQRTEANYNKIRKLMGMDRIKL